MKSRFLFQLKSDDLTRHYLYLLLFCEFSAHTQGFATIRSLVLGVFAQGRDPSAASTPMSSSADHTGPVAGRRAADGSEIAGGRKDAPSGWGEGTTSIGRRPAVERQDKTAAVHVDDEETEGDAQSRRRGGPGAEGEIADLDEAAVVDEGLGDDDSSGPRNAGGRKMQGLDDLAYQNAAGANAGLGAGATGGAAQGPGSSAGNAGVLSGIDLSLLTAVIAPPEALEEPDEPWQFDRMLQEISQVSETISSRRRTQGKFKIVSQINRLPFFSSRAFIAYFAQELSAENERKEAEENAAR